MKITTRDTVLSLIDGLNIAISEAIDLHAVSPSPELELMIYQLKLIRKYFRNHLTQLAD